MNCKYCNKNQQENVICCLWSYYANQYSEESQGFVEWCNNNKQQISGITKRAEELRDIR